MFKSNGRGSFGRRSGTATVIETHVHNSSVRSAKVTFAVVAIAVGLVSAVVFADKWHPILAALAGALLGMAIAAPIALIVLVWPVLRMVIWWWIEITIALALATGWVWLAEATSTWACLIIVAVIVGVPAALPYTRRQIVAGFWCLASRHRVRVCFSAFIIANRTGSLPLILWAHPIPVGERVWVWLRPGLSLADLESRLDKIAAACWASTVTPRRASKSNSAFVQLDIKRRDVLTGTIASPLVDMVDPDIPTTERDTLTLPTALDLPEVAPEAVTSNGKRSHKKPAPEPVPAPAGAGGVSSNGDDISDWI